MDDYEARGPCDKEEMERFNVGIKCTTRSDLDLDAVNHAIGFSSTLQHEQQPEHRHSFR